MKLLITTAWLLSLQLASGNEFVDQFKALKKAGDDAAIIQFLKQTERMDDAAEMEEVLEKVKVTKR